MFLFLVPQPDQRSEGCWHSRCCFLPPAFRQGSRCFWHRLYHPELWLWYWPLFLLLVFFLLVLLKTHFTLSIAGAAAPAAAAAAPAGEAKGEEKKEEKKEEKEEEEEADLGLDLFG